MKSGVFLRKTFFTILSGLFIVETIFLLLPMFFNPNSHRAEIVGIAKKELDIDFTFDDMSIKTYPDFSAKIFVKNPKLDGISDMENFELRVGVPKLLFRKIVIKSFKSKNSTLYFVRNKDNTTNLDPLLNIENVTFVLNNAVVDISNYKIFVEDNFVNQKMEIFGEKFSAKTNKKEIDLVIKSNLKYVQEKALIDLSVKMPYFDEKTSFDNTGKYLLMTGVVKNLKPHFFKEYIKMYFDKEIVDIQGVINAEFKPEYSNNNLKSIDTNVSVEDFKFISKKKENSIIFDKKISIKSFVSFNKKNMKIENCELHGINFKILLNGMINKYKSKNPNVDLNVKIDNSKVEALYWMLPSTLSIQQMKIQKLKKYEIHADANGEVQIKGSLLKPEVYGKVDFINAWLPDCLASNVPKAIIKTNFDKDKVNLDAKVWMTPKEYVMVKGWSDFYDLDKNEYQINSTQAVPLDIAQKMIVPVSDVARFVIGPVPIMKIKGYGNVDLFVKGSVKNPYYKGYINFLDGKASFNDINFTMEHAFGRLDFKTNKVYFNTHKAFVFGQPITLSGVSDNEVNVDYKASINNVEVAKLLNVMKTSPQLKEYSQQVEMIEAANGLADLKLNITGKIDDIFDFDAIKYLTPTGELSLHNVDTKIKNPKMILKKVNGLVKFDSKNIEMDVLANLYNSSLKVIGNVSENADLKISSDKMKLSDSLRLVYDLDDKKKPPIDFKNIANDTIFKMDLKYKGNPNDVELDKINLLVNFPQKKSSKSIIDVLSGDINLNKGNLKSNNIKIKFYNTTMQLDGNIQNALKKPNVNMDMNVAKLDLAMLNELRKTSLLPPQYNRLISAYKDFKGTISAKLSVRNNNLNGKIWLRNISFSHAILGYPFSIKSADLNIKNNNTHIKSLNATFAGTPIFLNGNIDNIFKNPKFDMYFTAKLSNNFVDNYINTNLSYPINLKGEVLFSSKVTGTSDSINMKSVMKLEEGADVSYMGVNFGETNHIREISGEIQKIQNKFVIKNMDYSKYIYSQNNRLYPLHMINLKSEIKFSDKDAYIENMHIKTFNPIRASLFNILFKKSLIKSGNVNCDLTLRGSINNPKIVGNAELKNIDIPAYEVFVKEVNMIFNPKHVDINAKTDYMGSDIDVKAKVRNGNFNIVHFDNLEIHSKKLDLNKLLNSFNQISYSRPIQIIDTSKTQDQIVFDTKHIIVDNGKWLIDEVLFRTLAVSNFSAKFVFNNNSLKISKMLVDAANGKIKGDFTYNFTNALIDTKLDVSNVDANRVAYSILDINNQIFGKLDGNLDITTFGASDEERLKNLNGNLKFNVANGKMPKLGSIEYLLRAGNLFKSGISGLTINSVTGLLVPVKTGNFDTISGNLNITNGIARKVKIYSKGKNLSILVMGDFDLLTSEADIYILGKLSKKIDTVLGPVGNASLNSFFNLIPGIHLDELHDSELIKQINSIPELGLKSDKFRIFRAKVDGDIYSEKFVSVFEWIDK